MDLWFNSILDTDKSEFANESYVRRIYIQNKNSRETKDGKR